MLLTGTEYRCDSGVWYVYCYNVMHIVFFRRKTSILIWPKETPEEQRYH